jgi:hypothetical protein
MTSWARVQFDRKQLNKVLVRCKNGEHTTKKQRVVKRDRRRLDQDLQE